MSAVWTAGDEAAFAELSRKREAAAAERNRAINALHNHLNETACRGGHAGAQLSRKQVEMLMQCAPLVCDALAPFATHA